MKIEKISETQVKFILNQVDLDERNIRLTELAYGTEKTQALFREMMEQALIECGFEAENVPLMIEAIPFAPDSITIIVTKVTNVGDIEEKFNMLPKVNQKKKEIDTETKKPTKDNNNLFVFSFSNLDEVAYASSRIYGIFDGVDILFKNQNRYFLFLQYNEKTSDIAADDLDSVLAEYGQKHTTSYITKNYLEEHGEIIIKSDAIKVLSNLN